MRRFLSLVAVALSLFCASAPARAGDITYEPGVAGLSVASLSLFGTTDLSGLASGGCATTTLSAITQTSTQFSALSPGGAINGWVDFQPLGAFTPTAGGYIAVYLLRSGDGGSTFETTFTCSTSQGPVNRAADFNIPLVASALANGNHVNSGYGQIPPGSWKAVLWNNSGAAFSANNHALKLNAFVTWAH